jgi:hypothetical protein
MAEMGKRGHGEEEILRVLREAELPIRWGVTLIIDLTTNKVLYRIPKLRKDTDRPSRHATQINNIGFSRLALEEPFMLLHQS